VSADALAAVEHALATGDEADAILREVVAVLHERLGRFARVSFLEGDGLVPGPAAGAEQEVESFPVSFDGSPVAALELGAPLSDGERALAARVAELIGPYALVGWDTGGEAWEP